MTNQRKNPDPTMRTARVHAHGGPAVIRTEVVPRPRPAPGEVLVRVAATSFNPTEAAQRAGLLRAFLPVPLPYAPGWDVAGTVVARGPGTTGPAVGDRVVGRFDGGGAAAEYVSVPADLLVPAPRSVPLAYAAALPVAGLTAWQAVFEHGGTRPGQRVLVNGAGGGVGGFATQLAKHAGAEVLATAGPRSAAAVREHGADRVIDHTAGPLAAALDAPVDLLLNLVPLAPPAAEALVPLVRRGGRIVSIATPVEPAADTGVSAMHFVARNDRAQLSELVGLVDAGVVRIDVGEVRPLTELAEVHRLSESGGIRGKVLIVP
ncbi:NADP-dependent oxidoreductase (plasmid) [Streptomyces sp. BI20]|uniref:NADP-dependent oxidoreductase n=1 Tax=Streptomyces sp. BI20 TaxID=3403460 RepID=UPI003C74A5FE